MISYLERHAKLKAAIAQVDETISTQYRDAKHVQRLRDDALRTRNQTLKTTYEEALLHYQTEYKEEPWLIIAKQAVRSK